MSRSVPLLLTLPVLLVALLVSGCESDSFGEPPDYDSLVQDLAGLPGVIESDVEVESIDEAVWTTRVETTVDPDISSEELVDAVDVFDEVAAQAPPGHGLAAWFSFEHPEGATQTALLSNVHAERSSLERVTWLLDSRTLFPDANVVIAEDELRVALDDPGTAGITEAGRKIAAQPSLTDAPVVTVASTDEAYSLTAAGPIDDRDLDRWAGVADAVDALPATHGATSVQLLLDDAGHAASPDTLEVVLDIPSVTGDRLPLAGHRQVLAPLIGRLLDEAFSDGAPGTLRIDKVGDPTNSIMLDIRTDDPGGHSNAVDEVWNDVAREHLR